MTAFGKYLKGHIALAGSLITAALAIFPPHTVGYQIASGAAAVLTGLGVYLAPNKKAAQAASKATTSIGTHVIHIEADTSQAVAALKALSSVAKTTATDVARAKKP